MQAEQAVFTSARTARMSGYHLVARSPGVDAELAAAISLWGPTHGSLSSDDWETSAISCFRIDERWLALARTVYGGPEYSERGRQIVTLFLLMTDAQWRDYDCHPLRVLQAAQCVGHLRLPVPLPERLSTLRLPDEVPTWVDSYECDAACDDLLEPTMRCLDRDQRVAIVGVPNPLPLMDRLLRRTPPQCRHRLSFSTGLRISVRRPFRIHFVSKTDSSSLSLMQSLGIARINAEGTHRAALSSAPH